MELEDFEDLVDFRVTSEKCLFLNQLSENAANSPDINPQTVLLLP